MIVRDIVFDIITTGPEPQCDSILEMAAIAVDDNWEVVSKFHIFLGISPRGEAEIDEELRANLEKSGLLAACRALKVNVREAEKEFIHWWEKLPREHLQEKVPLVIFTNATSRVRSFLEHDMPTLASGLSPNMVPVGCLGTFVSHALGEIPHETLSSRRAMVNCDMWLADIIRTKNNIRPASEYDLKA